MDSFGQWVLTKRNSVLSLALRITWETCVKCLQRDALAGHRQWVRLEELLSFVKGPAVFSQPGSLRWRCWFLCTVRHASASDSGKYVCCNWWTQKSRQSVEHFPGLFFFFCITVVQGSSRVWEWILLLHQVSRYLCTSHLRTETHIF